MARKIPRRKANRADPRLDQNTQKSGQDVPAVQVVRVRAVSDDGDLICQQTGHRDTAPDDLPQIIVLDADARRTRPPLGAGDRLLVRIDDPDADHLIAKVIRRLGEGPQRMLAVVRKRGKRVVADPVERRKKDSYWISPTDTGQLEDGDIIWIEPQSGRRSGSRTATVKSREGNIEERGAYSLLALAAHGIPVAFPDAVIEAANDIDMATLEGRTDLRDIPLLTIDPADAKDHDDAVAAWPDDHPDHAGGFIIVVAIADVSWFVRPGTSLDREAQKRGNSVYLPDRVVPMLPERLSTDLCSLRPDEDRPCLAVEMRIRPDGRLRSHRFMRGMMRSKARLSYEEAQSIIREADDDRYDPVRDCVKTLHKAFQCRMKERGKRAPLDLELPERRIILNEEGKVADVKVRERFDAHQLIEEFMILANVAAAEVLEAKRRELIYRVHDRPDPEKLNAVRDHLQTMDYRLVKGGSLRPSHFNQILKIAEQRDQKEMISELILRTQRQAVYATENLGHFGLNLPRYAHFTSPIRR